MTCWPLRTWRTCSRRSSTAWSPSASTCGANRPPIPSWPARGRCGWSRGRPRSSKTRWPGRPVRVRDRGGSSGAGGRAARTRRGRGGGRPRRIAGAPVIKHPAFRVEPWCLREQALDLDVLAQTESVFALSNGHIGWRGNLDEGEPHGLPGSYLNGVYENRPLASAEAAYDLPQTGQTVINVTNGKLIRLFVDDEPFDVRYGTLRKHERELDFRDRKSV